MILLNRLMAVVGFLAALLAIPKGPYAAFTTGALGMVYFMFLTYVAYQK